MITVLEEMPTGLQREGRILFRRVYLVPDCHMALPTDGAPGSLALVREGEAVATHILFPDGVWGRM
ncbi:MAG: hypothetical protein E7585_07505 [Ruminococcaceae bacterium]|nr:hypothetical protein [Oscillospiraceae bacterium]